MSKSLITREQRAAAQGLWQQVLGLSAADPDRSFGGGERWYVRGERSEGYAQL